MTSLAHAIGRPPQDNEELWWLVSVMWGIEIPRVAVCDGHKAPFDAFADAFFARYPVVVWKASRGFGGKTTMMGTLTATEGALLGAHTTVLGGSSAQSLRVKEVMQQIMESPHAPIDLLKKEPTRFVTSFKNGGNVIALMASQRSVRGPHPQRLRLDEIDEMDMDILEAAQGQPMNSPTVRAQTVMSSTHQHPDKTMTAILKRAEEKGWPVYEWCWRESMQTWLTQEEVDQKRAEVSQAMWEIEYDLQEPSFEGRAIDGAAVERAFDSELGEVEGVPGKYYEWEEPDPKGHYITAADWAKRTDWSIIGTYRIDEEPWRLVAWERLGRQPWPEMVDRLNERKYRFGGTVVHDRTGIGDVVSDLVEFDGLVDFVMSAGSKRNDLLADWVSAIETGKVIHPRIIYMYDEHRYVQVKDIYGRGHPPDSVVMGALAWNMRSRNEVVMAAPEGFTREVSPWVQ